MKSAVNSCVNTETDINTTVQQAAMCNSFVKRLYKFPLVDLRGEIPQQGYRRYRAFTTMPDAQVSWVEGNQVVKDCIWSFLKNLVFVKLLIFHSENEKTGCRYLKKKK